jgi:regulator of sigma E protease
MLLAIVAIILTLILVVGIHEGGHALAARYFKVKIKKVAIGFGKPLLHWQSSSGCEWIWAMFPLGGYVQLENSRISPVKTSDYSSCFDKKSIWQRIVILLSGAMANFIIAWIALVLVFTIGLNYTLPQIKSVLLDSPAARGGVAVGDQFISIAGHATPSWSDVGMQLVISWGKKEVPFVLSTDGGKKFKVITVDLSKRSVHGLKPNLLVQLGVEPDLSAPRSTLRFPIAEAIHQANATIIYMLYFFLMIFKQLFSGVLPFSMLLGPLSIFTVSVASLTQGFVVFMFFIATLSLAVGLVNLFPIPGLDGGSIVYALIEKIRGKAVSVAMELLLHRLAFIIFCVILVHLLMNDLQRL